MNNLDYNIDLIKTSGVVNKDLVISIEKELGSNIITDEINLNYFTESLSGNNADSVINILERYKKSIINGDHAKEFSVTSDVITQDNLMKLCVELRNNISKIKHCAKDNMDKNVEEFYKFMTDNRKSMYYNPDETSETGYKLEDLRYVNIIDFFISYSNVASTIFNLEDSYDLLKESMELTNKSSVPAINLLTFMINVKFNGLESLLTEFKPYIFNKTTLSDLFCIFRSKENYKIFTDMVNLLYREVDDMLISSGDLFVIDDINSIKHRYNVLKNYNDILGSGCEFLRLLIINIK